MKDRRLIDAVFVILAFGIYIITLNVDKNIDNCSFLSKHIWLPLIIAYYIGRSVSSIKKRNKPNSRI